MQRLELINRERDPVEQEALARFHAMGERRLRGEPVARILGEADFYGLVFELSAATLVPRPETEMLVMRTLVLLEGRQRRRILDLGTGTGCIAISILTESPSTTAVATDVSDAALEVARANAARHGVARRLDLRTGAWFDPMETGEAFDVVVSNPPYIARAVIETLAREVREHDPHGALDGGPDGLDAYRAILGEVRNWLKPDGWVVVEIGHDQGSAVRELFLTAGLDEVVIEKDLAGLDRVAFGHHS